MFKSLFFSLILLICFCSLKSFCCEGMKNILDRLKQYLSGDKRRTPEDSLPCNSIQSRATFSVWLISRFRMAPSKSLDLTATSPHSRNVKSTLFESSIEGSLDILCANFFANFFIDSNETSLKVRGLIG